MSSRYYDIWGGIVCILSPWSRLLCLVVVPTAGVCQRVLMTWIVTFSELKYGMYQGYGAAPIKKYESKFRTASLMIRPFHCVYIVINI